MTKTKYEETIIIHNYITRFFGEKKSWNCIQLGSAIDVFNYCIPKRFTKFKQGKKNVPLSNVNIVKLEINIWTKTKASGELKHELKYRVNVMKNCFKRNREKNRPAWEREMWRRAYSYFLSGLAFVHETSNWMWFFVFLFFIFLLCRYVTATKSC